MTYPTLPEIAKRVRIRSKMMDNELHDNVLAAVEILSVHGPATIADVAKYIDPSTPIYKDGTTIPTPYYHSVRYAVHELAQMRKLVLNRHHGKGTAIALSTNLENSKSINSKNGKLTDLQNLKISRNNLILHYYEKGLTRRQIAEKMKLSYDTVKDVIYKKIDKNVIYKKPEVKVEKQVSIKNISPKSPCQNINHIDNKKVGLIRRFWRWLY